MIVDGLPFLPAGHGRAVNPFAAPVYSLPKILLDAMHGILHQTGSTERDSLFYEAKRTWDKPA
ncbi:MAG: hypothetical protein PHW13_11050 [Methylococcales bacterium]|nr:hypothetical protein [Methylococcales bacterium]